ncbi:MAG: lipoate--protein ligase family protein [Bacteroidaceae bacterium]|nr:lipoate--protein ligase family protein [Bacteroidaceae bacterium]
MIHLVLPNNDWRPLPFYLAMEEVAARHFQEECFFTWVVSPTVIFGRNQVMHNEVNLPFCQTHGIQLVRRKSGGGCVYADEGNIMLSYITPTDNDVEHIFARYLGHVVDVLRGIGVPAEATGRNDILVQGRKISGNAMYSTENRKRTIVHGTMLHSTDIERMVNAITPSDEKLAAKGVQSVRQRVINLSEVSDISIPDLRNRLTESLCNKTFFLTEEMVVETEGLMQEYLSKDWIDGKFKESSEVVFPACR